jgi:hypothetical protein
MAHKLKMSFGQGGMGTVTLDGVPIDTVAVGFNASIDELTEATLVIPCEVEIDADVDSAQLRIVQCQPTKETP